MAFLLASVPAVAHAQDLPADKGELEARRAEIAERLDEAVAARDAAAGEVAAIETDIERLPVLEEVIARRLAEAFAARQGPATVQREATLSAYMDGRSDGALNDAIRLTVSLDNVNARELYRAVVEAATLDVQDADAALLRLREDVTDTREQLASRRAALDAARAARAEAEQSVTDIEGEIARVDSAITAITYFDTHAPLTGRESAPIARPALVVKIDNVPRARPQAGINDADVVVEEIVEGAFTRLAAVFHSRDAALLGPVRSARTTDIDLFANLDRPLFANSGANSGTLAALSASSLVDVGANAESGAYRRDRSRRAPHNLMTTTAALWGTRADRSDPPPPLYTYRLPGDGLVPGAQPSSGVLIDYGSTTVSYDWNGNGWARSQDGTPHLDEAGTQVAPANLIVQFTRYTASRADSRSPEAVSVGRGDAWVFTDGHVVRGTWVRDDASAPTRYEVDGAPIALTPGTTWVHLPEIGTAAIR